MVLHVINESTTETRYEPELAHPTLMDNFFGGELPSYQDATESKESAIGRFRVRVLDLSALVHSNS